MDVSNYSIQMSMALDSWQLDWHLQCGECSNFNVHLHSRLRLDVPQTLHEASSSNLGHEGTAQTREKPVGQNGSLLSEAQQSEHVS